MGSFSPQIQAPQSQIAGKGSGINPPPGQINQDDELQKTLTGLAGGTVTTPSQQGQPQMGVPNAYANTVQPYNPQQPDPSNGKGNLLNNQNAQKALGKGV
jgi:hypothetical protein